MSELYKNVEEVATDKLVPYTNNPKNHPDEQVDKIAGSIKEFGFTQPLVVTEDDTVVIGHGRLKAAKKLGLDFVPVIRRSDLSEAEVKALRLADNKVAESGWDDESLAVELQQLNESEMDLGSTGFDEEEFAEILDGFEEESVEVEQSKVDMPDDLKDWKILNLYAGIGGNRRFWPDECEIVHVEYNEEIAKALEKIHPGDRVVVADAHKFLLENFQDYDFIWSSPPCPTHSRMRKNMNPDNPVYPDMKLYEEILLLQGFFKGKWVVENVRSWYEPLIEPQEVGRHYYWANFEVPDHGELDIGAEIGSEMIENPDKKTLKKKAKQFGLTEEQFEFIPSLSDYPKDKIIRNMVHPDTGETILKAAFEQKNQEYKLKELTGETTEEVK